MQQSNVNIGSNIFVGLTSTDYAHIPSSAIDRLCENEQPKNLDGFEWKDSKASEGSGAKKNKCYNDDF